MRITYRLISFLVRSSAKIFFGLVIEGMDKIPRQGKLLIAANHQSYLDPPILGSCLPREVNYLAKAQLFQLPILGALIRHLNAFPVQRDRFDLEAIRTAARVLENGGGLILFPEGTRSRTGAIRNAAGGIGLLAKQTNAPVFPVYIGGTRGVWRRPFRKGSVKIIIGEPIQFAAFNKGANSTRDVYLAFSRHIMEKVAELKAAHP